jgi:hypothetical protein
MDGAISDILFVIAGIVVVLFSTGLAITTFMIPGTPPPLINRFVLRVTQIVFDLIIRPIRSESRRHRVLSLFAPVALLTVLGTILLLLGFGYTLLFYGVGVKPFIQAILFSGSALSTLGTESPGNNIAVIVLSVIEALTAITVVAILIGYVPNIFSAYQDRERAVVSLEALVGTQADAVKVLDAYISAFGPAQLGNLWATWLEWFGQLVNARTTLAGDLYLRSSRWDRSWVIAAGAVLDAASLVSSSVDLSTDPAADRLVAFGSHVLNDIVARLHLRCPATPTWPDTPINVTQDEFNAAYDHLQSSGLPMKPDQDAAWNAFARYRVEYECALMTLIRLKRIPKGARWTTDRPEADRPLALPVLTPRAATDNLPSSRT